MGDRLRLFSDYVASFDTRLRNPRWVLERINRDTLAGKEGNRSRSEFVEDTGGWGGGWAGGRAPSLPKASGLGLLPTSCSGRWPAPQWPAGSVFVGSKPSLVQSQEDSRPGSTGDTVVQRRLLQPGGAPCHTCLRCSCSADPARGLGPSAAGMGRCWWPGHADRPPRRCAPPNALLHHAHAAGIERRFRSKLDDFRGSGYDRGHMAPAANHKTSQQAMDDTFSLTNMSPQARHAAQHPQLSCWPGRQAGAVPLLTGVDARGRCGRFPPAAAWPPSPPPRRWAPASTATTGRALSGLCRTWPSAATMCT